ncbi:hypothetical protein [Accumulibacter sp.]|uniref:hypothetical protein n=1 Tax=Accumulibacter sp. TaxID=2053492 RepID=UPI0026254F06|nr:hypothetical protein [Accumulibacter sp.]
MKKLDKPLDADDLIELAERVAGLPPADAEWVGLLLQDLLRARTREAELLAGRGGIRPVPVGELPEIGGALNDQMAQVALDTAEWLRTLWNVGYMGAGSFRSQPRTAFPTIDLEDVRKSSLFARIRQGKHALPFAPPTRQGLPWHELIEGHDQIHDVQAEIIHDDAGLPLAAIIEGCSEWSVLKQIGANRAYQVQHQRKGPIFHLRISDGTAAQLWREAPTLECKVHLIEHGGLHSYALEWAGSNGRSQIISLRAATWARAESEAAHWVATNHPELYGQVSFKRFSD